MHAAKTVVLAIAGSIAALLIVTNIHLAIITFAAVVTVPVIVGQLIRMQPFFLAIIPPAHQSLVPELLPGLVPQPYAQAVLFRAEARGLPSLLIPPLYSMLLAAIVVSGVWQHWNWNPSDWRFPILALWYVWVLATGFAALRSWMWVTERLLFRKGAVALGIVGNAGGETNLGLPVLQCARRALRWYCPSLPLAQADQPFDSCFRE